MSEVKILVCDDDPALMGLLERRLKKMGIEPDAASDGRQAKSFVDENHYDVIVTDIYMPEATGLEVMQHAKQKDPEVQVVIITSSATLENAIDALNHGAFGYLTKPFDHLIVFDNMVSRALEYRTLLVADRRKAEAQKRRGDMLEDEVEERVKQLQKTQKGLLDLLGSLPDGVLVVEEGGKVVLSSPVGERWLALDDKTDDRLIHAFINQVHAEMPETMANVTINDTDLHLMVADFRSEGDLKRKAVIIREAEDDAAGAGSMVTETVMGIKKGLATLYEQGVGTEVVLNVASQFAVLEQLQGWSGGTGELAEKSEEAEADLPVADASAPATAEPAQTPSEPAVLEPAVSEQAPTPEAPGQATEDPAVTSVPPFTIPRERTPTGELEGPRLNTSELQDALRSAAPPDAVVEPPVADVDQATDPTGQPEAPATVDPAEETLVSSTASSPDAAADELSPIEQVEAMARAHSITEAGDPSTPPETVDVPTEQPTETQAQPADSPPADSPGQEGQPEEVVPVDSEVAATPDLEIQVEPAASVPPLKETDEPDFVASVEPDTQPTGVAVPPEPEEAAAAPWDDAEGSTDDSDSFPRAQDSSSDVPSWIDGIEGITDPDLLEDFEFEHEQADESFPKVQNGEVLDDDSMFKPRVIPEEMDAKLETPVELPKTNGDQEYAPPQHDGPITIQASQADTQIFRKVLEGLSGTNVLSGDYEKAAEEPMPDNGDVVAEVDHSLDDLRAEFSETPVDEPPVEVQQTEPPPPSTGELRAAEEPDPEPIRADPAQWPPVLPTEDEDWDDELDVTG